MKIQGKNCEIQKFKSLPPSLSLKAMISKSYLNLPPITSARRSSTNKQTESTRSKRSPSPLQDSYMSQHTIMKRYSILTSIPFVSATSCCIYNVTNEKFIYQKNDTEIKEIASLGKIMTCYLCIKLCRDYKISIESPVIISKKAANITGTSSDLIEGASISIKSLLYGLMLPSGNDSA